MKHKEKIDWMIKWAHENRLRLELEGECGFGRECVGVCADIVGYPDYEWSDDETYERLDKNGDVWTPKDAYHKYPCVAVLGRGPIAEGQLYEWLKWFADNNFTVETGMSKKKNYHPIEIIMGKHQYARMVRQA
jgi:hypothetical protein